MPHRRPALCLASRLALAAGLTLSAGPVAAAGPAGDPAPPAVEAEPQADVPPAGVSPEELEAIQKALGGDAADAAARPSAAPSAVGAAIQSMNPDLSVILDGALSWFSDADPLQGGAHDPSHTGFTLQQLELHLSANVDPFFRLDANIVLNAEEVELEEAYATSLGLPAGLQLRAGQFLTRFGRINATHPHQWHFVDQPIVLSKMFGGEGSRGVGAELSWLTPLPWYVELVATATEATGGETARSFYGDDDGGVGGLGDLLYTLALKQFFPLSDDWSLLVGLSAQLGPSSAAPDARTVIYGGDLMLRWRPLAYAGRTSVDLTVEGLGRHREVAEGTLDDWGLYAQLVWALDAEWELGARFETTSGVAGDPLDPEQTGARHRTALEVAFYPSHFSRVRLQGALDQPSWRDEPIGMVTLALELLAGAHGAHGY